MRNRVILDICCMHVRVCVYVCMYICMYVCVYMTMMCMYVCMYMCMYVCNRCVIILNVHCSLPHCVQYITFFVKFYQKWGKKYRTSFHTFCLLHSILIKLHVLLRFE